MYCFCTPVKVAISVPSVQSEPTEHTTAMSTTHALLDLCSGSCTSTLGSGHPERREGPRFLQQHYCPGGRRVAANELATGDSGLATRHWRLATLLNHLLLRSLPLRLRPLPLLIPPIMRRLVRRLFLHPSSLPHPRKHSQPMSRRCRPGCRSTRWARESGHSYPLLMTWTPTLI